MLRAVLRVLLAPVLAAALAAVLVGAGPTLGAGAAVGAEPPRPVLHGNFADPTVEAYGAGFVGMATGDLAPRAWTRRNGTWVLTGQALSRLPDWSRPGHIWAADLHRIGKWWLLYYSAPVAGLGEYGRCVAVARSRSPLHRFDPVGDAPLVCPAYADTPPAQDQPPRDEGLPRAGVIDPSVFVDSDRRRHLLYKTDRIPSSIRMVPLSRNGLRVRSGSASRELLRHDGVLENPVLLQRSGAHVLLLSEGDFTTCRYRTVWRRTTDVADWSEAESGVLLSRSRTGLCGPGGADVAQPRRGRLRIYLHGWTCRDRPRPCRTFSWAERDRLRGVRSMYAATLRWPGGRPAVAGWLRPR